MLWWLATIGVNYCTTTSCADIDEPTRMVKHTLPLPFPLFPSLRSVAPNNIQPIMFTSDGDFSHSEHHHNDSKGRLDNVSEGYS